MCGIIGRVGNDDAVEYLLKGLEFLEYRGYDSAGIALCGDNETLKCKAVGRLVNLRRLAREENLSGKSGIGHTRWATHGEPTVINAHPHFSQDGNFAIVHNGIIENSKELYSDELENVKPASDTDTEVIAHLLQKYYDGDVIKTVSRVARLLTGSFALGIICRDFPETLFCTAKASPLVVACGNGGSFISSDAGAVAGYTDEIYPVRNAEICRLTASGVDFYDASGEAIKKEPVKIVTDGFNTDKQGYEHYMLLEMLQQPAAVRNTLAPLIKQGRISFDSLDFDEDYLKNKLRNIVIVACGSAYHVGEVARQLIESLCRIPCRAEVASEFRYSDPLIDEHTLAIFISQSGETADTLAALRIAKKKGAEILSVVNVSGSAIANESDNVIYTKAGREIAVATTKAYSAQLAVMYAWTIYLARVCGKLSEEKEMEFVRELVLLPEKMEQTIERIKDKSFEISAKVSVAQDVYFIGRRLDYAASLEGSLKMKEISYIHSEAYAAGELKHGTISLIDKGTIVFAVVGDGEIFGKTYSNIREVVARGADMIVVTTDGNSEKLDDMENVISVPEIMREFSVSLLILPLQWLSYYTAKRRGCDIDKPKNLAKSVTVE